MSVKSFLISRPKLAKIALSKMSAAYWQKECNKTGFNVFNEASGRVLAYKKLLHEQNLKPKEIKNINDFDKLPILDKKNYIKTNNLKDLVLDGTIYDKYTAERSSGFSGNSYFWPRCAVVDELVPQYLEFAFLESYRLDKKKTLIIMSFALGTWTTGEKVADSLRRMAASDKYPLTVITPGASSEEVLDIIENLSPFYDQTVIVGYPPFVKLVVEEGIKQGIDWPKLHIKIGLGGEGHSEHWRDYMYKKLAIPENDLSAITSAYGAAEIGIGVGREYPITVLIRKLASKDVKLARELFGEDSVLPCLYQYNNSVYIEEVDGELVFTAMNGIPIVRYNIHDRGGVIDFNKMMKITRDHGYNIPKILKTMGYSAKDIWKFPFFYVFGRSDGTISTGGANIYPENFEEAIYHSEDYLIINSYKLSIENDEEHNCFPVMNIELKEEAYILDETQISKLAERLHSSLMKVLLKVNSDYKDAYRVDPVSSDLRIKIFKFGTGLFSGDYSHIKNKYIA